MCVRSKRGSSVIAAECRYDENVRRSSSFLMRATSPGSSSLESVSRTYARLADACALARSMRFAFPSSLPSALADLRAQGFSVISSQLDGTPFFSRRDVSSSFVLIIGNEGNGISGPVKAEATHHLKLPMYGGAESLNASVAAGIMMYDLMRDTCLNETEFSLDNPS